MPLSPETEKYLEERLAGSDFASADDLVRTAVENLFAEPSDEPDEETQKAISEGIADFEAGRKMSIAEARRRHAAEFGD